MPSTGVSDPPSTEESFKKPKSKKSKLDRIADIQEECKKEKKEKKEKKGKGDTRCDDDKNKKMTFEAEVEPTKERKKKGRKRKRDVICDDGKNNMKIMKVDEEKEVENPNGVQYFRITEVLKDALKSKGIEALFPIQAATFDIILGGSDLVGCARSGQV